MWKNHTDAIINTISRGSRWHRGLLPQHYSPLSPGSIPCPSTAPAFDFQPIFASTGFSLSSLVFLLHPNFWKFRSRSPFHLHNWVRQLRWSSLLGGTTCWSSSRSSFFLTFFQAAKRDSSICEEETLKVNALLCKQQRWANWQINMVEKKSELLWFNVH